jgi:hypothetical protein
MKVLLLAFLALSVIAGYFIGRYALRRPISRLAFISLFFAGAIFLLVGLVGADQDYRFLALAIGGICLEVAGIVGSIRYQNTKQDRQVELWTPKKYR